MENVKLTVAKMLYIALKPYVETRCPADLSGYPVGCCERCSAKQICWAAVELKQETEKILRENGVEVE